VIFIERQKQKRLGEKYREKSPSCVTLAVEKDKVTRNSADSRSCEARSGEGNSCEKKLQWSERGKQLGKGLGAYNLPISGGKLDHRA